MNEENLELLYQVAESMICMKKYNYGAELYKKLIELDDKNAGIWHGYANCLEKLGELERSKLAYEKALEYHLRDINDGNFSEKRKAYLWGGWAAIKLGKVELSYDLFKKSVEEDPSYAYSWLSYAVACTKLKREQEAKEARENYKKYLKIKPYMKRECEGRSMLLDAREKATGWLKEYIEKILPETNCME
ncbi:MAG: tetratricopeptide repeat protein [Thermoplasmata archaeon]